MKKIVLSVLACIFIFTSILGAKAVISFANSPVRIMVNGELVNLSQPAITEGGVTFVAEIERVIEAMGGRLQGFHEANQTIGLAFGNIGIQLRYGSDTIRIRDLESFPTGVIPEESYAFEHNNPVPISRNGFIFWPVESIIRVLSGDYPDWDSRSRTIIITAPTQVAKVPPTPSALASEIDYITIRGRQFSTSLRTLDLHRMELTDEDIVPLRYMTNLTQLILRVNQISDLTPLSGLTNLTRLNLRLNRISDLAPLSGLTNLTYLNLIFNPITDWSPVAHVERVDGRPDYWDAPQSTSSQTPIPIPTPSATRTLIGDHTTVRVNLPGSQSESEISLAIFAPRFVTNNSILLSGNVAAEHSIILEMGFVLSRTNSQPTLQDIIAQLPSPQIGDFNITADRLTANANYFVRAFATFGTLPQDVVYSNTISIRTGNNAISIAISYRDANGFELGTQMISTTTGSVLTTRNLTYIPFGTRLQNPNWTHSVVGNETVIVTIVRESDGNVDGGRNLPTVPGGWDPPPVQSQTSGRVPLQGYDPFNEQPFMQSMRGRRFGPENYATSLEVAAMLYTLMADPFQTYHHDAWFPDVDYSNSVQANIVNFVTSRGYMAGDDEGRFLTNEPISRARVAVIVSEVLDLDNKYEHERHRSAFVDTSTHWSRNYVWMAVKESIMSGFEDGTFRPDNSVTRAEIAVIFSRMFNRSGMPMSFNSFVDVDPSHWAFTAIMNAAVPVD